MKTIKILYWVTTVLAALAFIMGSIMDLRHGPEMVAGVHKLGYPEYLLNILGIAKILGVIVLLIPAVPRLKEWAYSGFVILLIGAIWSHAASGDQANIIGPVVPLLMLAASYLLYRKLQSKPETRIAWKKI
jgi:uncharacterized membrane protein YphA (DoxX/SURF4 family)